MLGGTFGGGRGWHHVIAYVDGTRYSVSGCTP
jgi:hypothetical protein